MVPLLAMHTPRGRLFLRVWDKHAFLHGHTEPVRANLTLPRPSVRLSSSGARSWPKHHRFRLQNASRRCGVCVCERLYTVFYDKPSGVPDEPGQTYRTSQAKSKTLRPTSDIRDPRKSLHRANGRHTINDRALRSVLLRLSVTFLPVPNRQGTRTPSCGRFCPERVPTIPLYIYTVTTFDISLHI